MVIVVSILALIGKGVGMAAVLHTYGAGASPPPVAQVTLIAPEGPLLLAMGMKGALPAGRPSAFSHDKKSSE